MVVTGTPMENRATDSTDLPTHTFTPSATATVQPTIFQQETILQTPIESTSTIEPSMPTASPTPSNVNQLPDPEKFTWHQIAEGFNRPTGLVTPPDQSNRLFVLEQTGLIHILDQGQRISPPFFDITDRVSTKGSTVRGLLGMAFHPNYAQNGYFFIHYTKNGGDSVIARFQVSQNPAQGDLDSELRLLEISYPIGEHVGGDLQFGPDGHLYLPIGDGGGGGFNDEAGNAQNPDSYLGSILRIDVNTEEPYGIPSGNPYTTSPGRSEVWAIGLRNPWRISFDSLTGDLYIADVGENREEEINYLPTGSSGGANFGWNYFEGTKPLIGEAPLDQKFIPPIAVYDHTLGCSVTGGFVYRGSRLPEWYGVYIYGDYCTGNIWGLLKTPEGSWENRLMYQIPAYITTFGEDQNGEIYLASITGKIYQLQSHQE
jgi:glucose/arabinose dehydrogenase